MKTLFTKDAVFSQAADIDTISGKARLTVTLSNESLAELGAREQSRNKLDDMIANAVKVKLEAFKNILTEIQSQQGAQR